MSSVLRAMGPFNGQLPEATGQVVGFMRDPNRNTYLQYAQMVSVPTKGNGLYRWCELDPDMSIQVANLDEQAWGFDDYAPQGRDFQIRAKWNSGQTTRYAFGYTIGDRTQKGWDESGINLRAMYNRVRMGHAMIHRAARVVAKIKGYSWPGSNTSDLATLRGSAGYWDQSSGVEYTATGGTDAANTTFQIIKDTLNRVTRRLDLLTNNATTGEEFVCVMGPMVAQAIAKAGEIVNYLKQSTLAAPLMTRNKKWGVPDEYNGWKFVVEDTPRVFIRQHADGSVADVTQSTQKDYIWNDDSVFFCSRAGGLDGQYGFQNFSTVQLYTYNGEARVFAFSDPEHELTRGRIDIEDDIQIAAPVSGFYLTNVLST